MSARASRKKVVELRISEKISDMPKFMSSFLKSIENRTSFLTREKYVEYIKDFLIYIYGEDLKEVTILDVKNITSSEIEQYLNSISYYEKSGKTIPMSNSSKAAKLSAIRKLFEYLCRMMLPNGERVLSENPAEFVETPKIPDKDFIVVMDEEDLNTLKNNITNGVGSQKQKNYQKAYRNRDLSITSLLLVTGIRVSALIDININDVNLDECYVVVTSKGDRTSVHYFDESTKGYIEDWMLDRENMGVTDEALFVSSRKTRITDVAIRNIIKKYTYNIDKDITPHKFRSTFATKLYEKSGDIGIVADRLGHSNVNTTKKYYARTSEMSRKKAANIFNF